MRARLGLILLISIVVGCGRSGDLASSSGSAAGGCSGGCPTGQTCTSGACVPATTPTCDCAANETCVNGACTPSTTPPTMGCGGNGLTCPAMTQCIGGQCCIGGQICFPPLMPCGPTMDCPNGEMCQFGICLPGGFGGGGLGGGGGGGSGGRPRDMAR